MKLLALQAERPLLYCTTQLRKLYDKVQDIIGLCAKYGCDAIFVAVPREDPENLSAMSTAVGTSTHNLAKVK